MNTIFKIFNLNWPHQVYADKELYLKGSIKLYFFHMVFKLFILNLKKKKGFYGEMMSPDCGCTVTQKTHEYSLNWSQSKGQFNGSFIFILRNPYEAIISWRNFRSTGAKHTEHADQSSFIGKSIFKLTFPDI